MKRLFLITFSLLVFGSASAQQNADIGIWGGVGSYVGDMTQVDHSSSLKPAYGVFLRYNFNSRYSLRGTVMTGTSEAVGEFETATWGFSKSVTDLSLMGEFNFFRYIIGSKRYTLSTYILGGVGVSLYPYSYDPVALQGVVGYLNNVPPSPVPVNYSSVTVGYNENVYALNVPLGFGFKFNISERWGLGVETQIRKYFNDKLDDLDDPRKFYTFDSVNPNDSYWTEYSDAIHNNDWTFHLGLHLTYRFFRGNRECPVYENIN